MKKTSLIYFGLSLAVTFASFASFADQQTKLVKKSAASKKMDLTLLPSKNPLQLGARPTLKLKNQQTRVGAVSEEKNTSSSSLRPVLDPYHRTVSTGFTF